MALELVLRWAHILPAIILVGGTVFLRFVLLPSLSSLPSQIRPSFLSAWRPSWARLVMITSGLLLVTGLINAVRIIVRYDFEGGIYHGLVAAKLLLALGIFWISSVLAGRSPMAERFREKMSFWLTFNTVLAVLLVCLAGYMKFCPRQEKPDSSAATSWNLNVGPETLRSEHENG